MSEINVYQKILEVRKSIDKLSKDTEGYKYSYVSGTQILSKIKSKMDEVGLILEPHIIHGTKDYQIHQYETIDKQGNTKNNIDFLVSAEMKYKWVNVDNPEDYTTVDWATFGQQDEISKAFGSGLTYSERYFLLKYFGVPTDDDDPDKKQETKQYGSNKKLSPAQINRLFAIAKSKGVDTTGVKKVLMSDYNKTQAEDLTKQEYDEMIKRIEQKQGAKSQASTKI